MITINRDPEFIARLADSVIRHRRVLNFLEPDLPCVVCRGPLISGRCPECDPNSE